MDGAEAENEEAKLRVCECGPECFSFFTALWLKGGKLDTDRVRFFRDSPGNAIGSLAVEVKRCYVPKGDYSRVQEELGLMAKHMEYDRNLNKDTYHRRTTNNKFSKAQLEVQPALGWLFDAQFRRLQIASEHNPEWFQ